MVSAILTTAGADPDNLRDGKLLATAIRFAGAARSEPVDLDGSCVSLSLMTGIVWAVRRDLGLKTTTWTNHETSAATDPRSAC